MNAKVNGLVNLVNSVNSGSKLIDGIGTQMHLSVRVSRSLPYTLTYGLCRPVVPEALPLH